MRIVLHGRHAALRDAIAECMRASGHEVATIDHAAAIARSVEEQAADLAAVDLDDPEAGRHIEALRARFPSTGVLAISSDARAEGVVEALRRGAREVLFKPFGHEALARALERALPPCTPGHAHGPVWIAEDPLSLELLKEARAAAAGTATLLITGEIGTGKTQLARFVQARGPRASAPYVEVSGADLASNGAALAMLVGRDTSRPDERIVGCLERAHGGTLLVEDVDELDARAELALLEFLQEGRVRPLASSRFRHFDVRVIATARTARAPGAAEARASELRTRLGVLRLALRPLRERRGDIAPLARHFHALAAPERRAANFDERTCDALSALALPGNATELQNLMRQAHVVFADGPLDVGRLGAPLGTRRAGPGDATQREPGTGHDTAGDATASDLQALNLREMEREAVRRSLELARGNRTLAASALGVSTRTLRNKIRAYDLR